MNIPKEAIEKAIEGGWKERFGDSHWSTNNNQVKVYHWEAISLDPTFWQALGKALRWEHEHMRVNWGQEEHYYVPLWQFYASKFVNLILQGKDTTDFWQELSTSPSEE